MFLRSFSWPCLSFNLYVSIGIFFLTFFISKTNWFFFVLIKEFYIYTKLLKKVGVNFCKPNTGPPMLLKVFGTTVFKNCSD